jgi:hypothetical protein
MHLADVDVSSLCTNVGFCIIPVNQAIELGDSLFPQDVSTEQWYKEAERIRLKCERLGAAGTPTMTPEEEAAIKIELQVIHMIHILQKYVVCIDNDCTSSGGLYGLRVPLNAGLQ